MCITVPVLLTPHWGCIAIRFSGICVDMGRGLWSTGEVIKGVSFLYYFEFEFNSEIVCFCDLNRSYPKYGNQSCIRSSRGTTQVYRRRFGTSRQRPSWCEPICELPLFRKIVPFIGNQTILPSSSFGPTPSLPTKNTRLTIQSATFLRSKASPLLDTRMVLTHLFECISGTEGRLVNFNAEYDALPGIGHACGHNLIATASITAFLALSHLQKKYNIGCRIQLLGTPAEENGGGKAKLLDAGAYKEVDVSLMAYDSYLSPSIFNL